MLPVDRTPPWNEYVAIVTGAGRGIGAAVARALGELGARVVVNYRVGADAAEHVVAEVKAAGGDAIAVQADVAEDDAGATLVAAADEHWGRVDALVNNATPLSSANRSRSLAGTRSTATGGHTWAAHSRSRRQRRLG